MSEELLPLANIPVIEFLLGHGPLQGCHFSEKPEGERGNYWWRKHLHEAISAIDPRLAVAEKMAEALREIADSGRHPIAMKYLAKWDALKGEG